MPRKEFKKRIFTFWLYNGDGRYPFTVGFWEDVVLPVFIVVALIGMITSENRSEIIM